MCNLRNNLICLTIQLTLMGKISILLVDDHRLIRESWMYILNSDTRLRVIGETSNAEDAVRIAREKQPDIILMDVNMTPIDGFDTTRRVQKVSPESRVIGVSMHSMPAYARRLMQVGAMGYVTKNSSREEMITAILEVHRGNKYVCEEVKNILAQQELEDGPYQVHDLSNLSARELDIVRLLKEGLSSKEIADRLDLSAKTIEVHRYNILHKLNLKNTAALVNFANANGL